MHAHDSELWIVAHAITHPAAMAEIVTEGVGPDDIATPEAHFLMSILQGLHEEGNLSSQSVVRTECKDHSEWNRFGGEEWWSDVLEHGWGEEQDLSYHIRRVKRASKIRNAVESAEDALETIDGTRSIDTQEEAVESLSDDLLTARATDEQQVYTSEDMAEGFRAILAEGANLRIPSGLYSLDRMTGGLPDARVTVLAAPSDHGKTALSDWIATSVALRYWRNDISKQVVKFDLEQGAVDNQIRYVTSLANRLHRPKGGISGRKVEREAQEGQVLSETKVDALHTASEHLGQLPITFDHQPGADVSHIRARIQALSAQAEVGLIVVDYAGMVGEDGHDKTERVGKAMLKLHNLARATETPILLLSQVNRKSLSRDDGRARIGDLSWSDAIRKHCKMALVAHHPVAHWTQTGREGERPHPERYELTVEKNKGPRGMLPPLRFYADELRYVDSQDPGQTREDASEDGAPF